MLALDLLRTLVDEVPKRLRRISGEAASSESAPSKWSPKQELGHLLDSAANNHQRMVRTQLENEPKMPGYEQSAWVEVHRYQQRDWHELINLWSALNQQLLVAAEAVRTNAWARTCTIGDSLPLTLKFVFEDYLEHMMHHLQHIGVDVEDFRAQWRDKAKVSA